jgi:hypothetical protein
MHSKLPEFTPTNNLGLVSFLWTYEFVYFLELIMIISIISFSYSYVSSTFFPVNPIFFIWLIYPIHCLETL